MRAEKRGNHHIHSIEDQIQKLEWWTRQIGVIFFLRNLIDVCKADIEGGNRPNRIFTTTGWKNLELKFEEKTGDKRTRKQLKNKLDGIKRNISCSWSSRTAPLVLDGMRTSKLLSVHRSGGMNTSLDTTIQKKD